VPANYVSPTTNIASPSYGKPADAPKAVAVMSTDEKLTEGLRRSLKYMPADVAKEISDFFLPQAIAVMLTTLVAWGIAHVVGIGEIADLILVIVGFAAMGWSAVTVAKELIAFVAGCTNAKTEVELEDGAKHFASAVAMVGVQVMMAILLRKPARNLRQKGILNVLKEKPNLIQEPLPRPGALPLKFTQKMGAGKGWTDWYGNIRISSFGTDDMKWAAYLHEKMHAFLRPKFGPLRELRAGFASSAYNRTAILKYLEEVLAEGYSICEREGYSWTNVKQAFDFPVANRYVTVTQLATEGKAVGTVVVGSMMFMVHVLDETPAVPATIAPKEELECKIEKPECSM
jgi:hypothetical protein